MPLPLRVATIGTWGHLGDPIAEIRNMPDAKLVAHARACSDDDIPFVRKLSGNDSLPWFDDYHKMLAEIRPDVVIVSTRIDRINPIAIDAANAGCHLICEKPLAIRHQDLRQLRDAAEKNQIQCIAMLANSAHPVIQAAKSNVAFGEIGKVVLINTRKSYKWGNRPEWFGDRNIYGGTIGWVAVHALQMIYHLSGQNFVSVAGIQSNCVHPERADCEDSGLLILGLSGGGQASVSFDILRPSAAATHGDDWVRIVGSKGVLEANLYRGWCRVTTEIAPEREVALPPRQVYYAAFLREIAGSGGKPLPQMRESFMLTDVCLRARDAADRKTVETISPE